MCGRADHVHYWLQWATLFVNFWKAIKPQRNRGSRYQTNLYYLQPICCLNQSLYSSLGIILNASLCKIDVAFAS